MTSNPAIPSPSARRHAYLDAWVVAGLLVLGGALDGPPRGKVLVGEQTAPPVFSWKSRYQEALAIAREHELLVAVYFRPVVGVEPPAIRRTPKNLGELVSGVKVQASEVLELQERFAVTRLPALVVLDSREVVVQHWQESFPLDVWNRVARTFAKLEERHARDAKEVEAARDLYRSGRRGEAFERLGPLLRSRRTATRVLRAAEELEALMIEDGERLLLKALAAEGLISDDRLKEQLRGLFAAPMPPRLEERLDRELRRLESTTIGGRRVD